MKNKKILIVLPLIILILVVNSSVIFSATISTGSITNSKNLGTADSEIEKIGTRIFTAVSNVGIVASVVVIAIIGLKYMLGSVDEKAKYKETLMPYLIGAFLIFSASAIGKIVYNLFKNIT